MKAIILEKVSSVENKPLKLVELPVPEPSPEEILIKVLACGICHTELDEIEGRLPVKFPVIPGHEIIGRVEKLGAKVTKFRKGDRVGIAWINFSCGECNFCQEGRENLCAKFRSTGCNVNGGYAEFTLVSEDFAYPIPERFSNSQAAPLLCAGAIGYRALNLTKLRDGQFLGLYGFGASAHIVIQIVKYKYPNSKVFVFTRPHQKEHQNLARRLGADWTGATGDSPPEKLNCAIDFTPAWKPVICALEAMGRGGRLVINAIRKENKDKDSLLALDYAKHLWQEKEIKSVANITRKDAQDFLLLAAKIPILPRVQEFKLEEANEALIMLKQGKLQGAGVLRISD
ncbi:zinc-dependent alcohol dehydrogenase family protein [Candidatus Aerophobetes bacterium]|nr:zinc-dependent alcohol dehydrogenase family protein [Candidatus Aerophobetes bacterium]